ncbi:putative ankyrin repeat protein [Cotonvirus japonicus]|uniref:Ankyrin repeat protein n=1 Tax=Cotonvirus japonicus TaxID=2811091 RepID=A0ABN6EFU5_9VIRU|nr:putative ankyrin repeat protein [Cotonvirus japonicus]BCS83549.1 putative ankyrin repeat protein [Cotonvirus japonicus]
MTIKFIIDLINNMSDNQKLYLKVLNETKKHYDLEYVKGLNKLDKPFEYEGSCVKGGLYFSDIHNIVGFIRGGHSICIVHLPTNDPEFVMVKDPDTGFTKWRANKFILDKEYYLSDVSTYEFLISQGMDITQYNNLLFRYACEKGYLNVVKFLIAKGSNIQDYDNEAIQLASRNGHFNVVTFLVKNKANVTANNNYAIQMACKYGHHKIAKFLISQGANPMANRYYPIEIATQNHDIEMVKLLLTIDKTMVYKSMALDIAMNLDYWELFLILMLY